MKNPHAKLIPIDRHPNLFRNPVSEKIYFRGTIKGVSIKFSTGVTNLTEAKKIVEDKKSEIYHGKSINHANKRMGKSNPTVQMLWDEFFVIRSPKWSRSTQVKYRVAWDHGLKDFWANLRLNQIKSKNAAQNLAIDFENWYLRNKPGRAFFNTRKAILALLRHLELRDVIERKPEIQQLDRVINALIKRKKVGRVFDDDEMNALYNHAVNKRTRLAIMIYRKMGARKMEVLASKQERWDLKKAVAELWSSKKNAWRKVPIPDDLIPLLKDQFKASEGSIYLFPAATDLSRHSSSQVFDKDWTATKKAAEIVENGPMDARVHDLRHTFATQTVTDGWNPIIACAVLDMSLKIYQQVYAHVSESDKRAAMERSFNITLD